MAETFTPRPNKTIHGGLGWKPSFPDIRDKHYKLTLDAGIPEVLPDTVDLRPQDTEILDQSHLGACTSFAIAGMYRFVQKKFGYPDFLPSRLFIYYNERAMEGSIESDSGAMLRDGLKSAKAQGLCEEVYFPYNINTFAQKPSDEAYANAIKHEALIYLSVEQTLQDMKSCLAAGFPFVFGFTVYDSFQSREVAKTGIMPMPSPNERMLGGHAICAVGYTSSVNGGSFIIRNSWGTTWADHGYFYMPYDYITNPNLASDFWTLRTVTDSGVPPVVTPAQ